jgi:hypothetical protein
VVGRLDSAPPGPTKGCGYLVGERPVVVPMMRPLFAWNWGIEVSYYTPRSHGGFVSIDGEREKVAFFKGLHPLVLVHVGGLTSVTIESVDATVCVTRVQAGLVSPSGMPPA